MAAPSGWKSWVFGANAARGALVAAVVLALPFVATGLFLDDYMHQYLLTAEAPRGVGDRWHLFTFARGGPEVMRPYIAEGPYPWWTSPNLHFSFFRPLTALVANAEHALFGATAPLMHLHSIAWYVALVWVSGRLLRRSLGALAPAAALAGVLFAIDDVHALVAGWVANRNAAIAAVPALLGVLAHVRWREEGWRWGLPLSLVGAAVGLLGGEVAVGALAYLGAYELTRGPGSWAQRLWALAPMGALGLAYAAVYRWTDSGARFSGVYADPLRETSKYLLQAPAKLLTLWGAQVLGSTADLWLAVESARPALVASGVVGLALLAGLLTALWSSLDEAQRSGARWLAVGAALSTLPGLATFPLNRMLLMPSLGAAGLTSLIVLNGFRHGTRWVRWATRLVFATTVVLAPLGWVATAVGTGLAGHIERQAALETSLSDEALSGRVFVFSAPDPSAAMYPAVLRTLSGKPPARSWVTLSFASVALRLERVDALTVDVEVLEGRLLATLFEQLFRGDEAPVRVGDVVPLAGATLTVTEALDGRVTKVRLRFDAPPESGQLTFVQWRGDTMERLELPPVGQRLTLPRPNGLLSR